MTSRELRVHFLILKIFGIWAPKFNSVLFNGLYYFWRMIAILLMWILFISLTVDLCMQNNVTGMTRNFILSTTMLCCILKVFVLLLKRKEIVEMLDMLKLPCCLPKTADELNILIDYRRYNSLVAGGFLTLCLCTLLMQFGTALFYGEGIKRRKMPYSIWQPYSIEPVVYYALTYICLALSSLVSMPVAITIDGLIYGCMIITCSQLEILKVRLARLHTAADLKICVQQHNIIFQFSERIGNIFGTVVFVQSLLSMINICSIMIVIIKSESKAGSIVTLFFLVCMMVEVLLYCWNGNEISLESQSVAKALMNNDNWIDLPSQFRKGLLQIMVRSQKPMEIKAGRMLTLSLDTFMMILKTSYSAFNLLQQVSSN